MHANGGYRTRFVAATLAIAAAVPTVGALVMTKISAAKIDGQAPRAQSVAPRLLAFLRDDAVWLSDANGVNARRLALNASAPAWSPDGKRIAWAQNGNVYVSGVDGANIRQATFWPVLTAAIGKDETDHDKRDISHISWGARDNMLTFARDDRYRLSHEDAGPTNLIGGTGTVLVSVLFEVTVPAGRARPAPPRVVRDWGDDATGFLFSHHACPAWSPSGKYLAFVVNGDIWIWDTHRLAATAVYDSPNYRGSRANRGVTSLSWAPGSDNQLLYGLRRLDGSGLADAHLLTQQNGVTVRDARVPIHETDGKDVSDEVYNPRFSRDGKRVEYSRFGTVRAARLDGTGDRLLLKNAAL